MTFDPGSPEQIIEERVAKLELAVKRSEVLFNFYSAERRAGADPLIANERMAEFAKRLDARPSYEIELDAIRKIMESVS